MPTNPLGVPKFRAFDANGNPLAGGLLYSYEAGTLTPLATYESRAGDIANLNPVVLDANGEADVWLTPGVLYDFVLKDSAGVTQWSVGDYPSSAEQSSDTDTVATDPGGRLTLTSTEPVTTSDITGATTVYYAPYRSNKVPLYDGSAWSLHTIATHLSQTTTDATKSPAAVAADSNYDLFVWSDSGTLRLSRGPAWSSATSRGTGAGTTELERVDGRYVNKVSITNGPGAQRGLYVGTIRSDASSQVNDSKAKRHVWNAYHRTLRPMRVHEATTTWTYTTEAWRYANNSAANRLDFVAGLAEDMVQARVSALALNNSAGVSVRASIGLDSSTARASDATAASAELAANEGAALFASYAGFPGLGHHFLAWLERSEGVGTTTWYGAGPGDEFQSGINGSILA